MTDAVNYEYSAVSGEESAASVSRAGISRDLGPSRASRAADRAINELATWLSNELRNPLAPIRTAIHLLRRKPPSEQELKRWLEILDRQSARLVDLADHLLDISQVTRGTVRVRRQELDLAAIIARAVEACQPRMDAYGQSVHVELPQGPLPLRGDPVRLVQVLRTLLDHAARATLAGGQICLTVTSLGREMQIRVCNSVEEIVRELQELIPEVFDLFARGEDASEGGAGGLGFGLALAGHVIELHGGRLEVRSTGSSTGGEFLIRLPVSHTGSTAQSITAEPRQHRIVARHAPEL
jgi:signal transduction histidine kinase